MNCRAVSARWDGSHSFIACPCWNRPPPHAVMEIRQGYKTDVASPSYPVCPGLQTILDVVSGDYMQKLPSWDQATYTIKLQGGKAITCPKFPRLHHFSLKYSHFAYKFNNYYILIFCPSGLRNKWTFCCTAMYHPKSKAALQSNSVAQNWLFQLTWRKYCFSGKKKIQDVSSLSLLFCVTQLLDLQRSCPMLQMLIIIKWNFVVHSHQRCQSMMQAGHLAFDFFILTESFFKAVLFFTCKMCWWWLFGYLHP